MGDCGAEQPHSPADTPSEGLTYLDSGVDISAGDRAVELMGDLVRSTVRSEVIGGIGGFGGLFAVPSGYRQPVLVASTDGVGTKIAVAQALDRWDTIGIDLVAMCVDDLVCQGAEPLFFLDYQALGKTDPAQVRQVMVGIAEGCRQAGCAILGGELAEHPGTLKAGDVDLAGFAVGIVEADRILTGDGCQAGDLLIGLPSPGLRSNGYSLARRALLDHGGRSLHEPAWPGASSTLGEELLRPSVIYAPAVLAVLRAVPRVRAVAHITGGGLPGNLPRVLPGQLDAVLDTCSWEIPRIFDEIQRAGGIAADEMDRVFNLGVGMVVVVPPDDGSKTLAVLAEHGHEAGVIGTLVPGSGLLLRSPSSEVKGLG